MNKHAAIIRPKFEAVINALEGKLSGKGVAHWMNPTGGYFVSVYVMNGCCLLYTSKRIGITRITRRICRSCTYKCINDTQENKIT